MSPIDSVCDFKSKNVVCCRCQTEFQQRDTAVRGEPETQKKFHSYVLFLGELYLHLEVRTPLDSACVDSWEVSAYPSESFSYSKTLWFKRAFSVSSPWSVLSLSEPCAGVHQSVLHLLQALV